MLYGRKSSNFALIIMVVSETQDFNMSKLENLHSQLKTVTSLDF